MARERVKGWGSFSFDMLNGDGRGFRVGLINLILV